MPNSTVSSVLAGLAKVLQKPWSRRELAQFHRRGVEILRGFEVTVQDRLQAYPFPSAKRSSGCDEKGAPSLRLRSRSTKTRRPALQQAFVSSQHRSSSTSKMAQRFP